MAEETTTTLGFMSDEYVAGVLKHSRELQGRIASLESQLAASEAAHHTTQRKLEASQRQLTAAMGELTEARVTITRLRRCAECGCCADNYKCPANKEAGKR